MRIATADNPCGCPGYVPYNFANRIGLYEVVPKLGTMPSVSMDHHFVSWVGQRSILQQDLGISASRGHTPLVTIEPWPASNLSAQTLLTDIRDGKYDSYIRDACTDLGQLAKPVYVRWGHEMENVTGRYPWATSDAAAYITAYRYFVTLCKTLAPNTAYVWSPAGNKELSAYWPGASYVDVIGLSVYSYPAWELSYYGVVRPFVQAFGERYNFVQGYGKPVIIAELGAIGTDRDAWLRDALAKLPQFPLVTAALFFSAQDSAAWGTNFPAPDWRLPAWALDSLPPPWVAR